MFRRHDRRPKEVDRSTDWHSLGEIGAQEVVHYI